MGELSLESFLNEPLKAQVDLLNTDGLHADEIRIRLATKDDFEKIGLDRAYFLTSIKFVVEADDSGQPRIVITSEDPVLEPYLDFIVEARWPSGRLLREYTVLVDPPVFDQSSPVISASERVEQVEGIPAPAKKKQTVDSSGTTVTTRKSDLGAGEMPERDFSAATSASPVAGSRYMVRRDDTLWQIAQQAAPQGVSVHQTMLDIQRMNPNAFINGNINQVKAGYIVYLPDSGDISSENLSAAMAEVRQQNEDWRENRVSEPVSDSGPSLRISAEPEQPAGEDLAGESGASTGASAAALEDLEKAELDRAEMEQRMGAMREQVETLQRIVNLKDEQIAALQQELAGESDAAEEATGSAEESQASAAEDLAGAATEGEGEPAAGAPAAGTPAAGTPASVAKPEPVKAEPAKPVAKPKPKPKKSAEKPPAGDDGIMSKALYGVGALLLAIIAFLFVRRRGEREAEEELSFESEVESSQVEEEEVAAQETIDESADLADEDELAEEEYPEEQDLEHGRADRGYGERKNDEYVSDVDDVDALAEADIYIAYGRYPQAIELLKNAIGSEPANPAYRLKLLELYADMGDRDAALAQFSELKAIGEPTSLSRAEALLAGIGAAASDTLGDVVTEPELGIDPLELMAETDEPLEASFSGLEIEALPGADGVEEDLDLSADFTDDELDNDALDEDLVIAAESNGLSTKLDLARAYLDMGDDDGARQILEEVAAEGTDELKSEAQELLERIG